MHRLGARVLRPRMPRGRHRRGERQHHVPRHRPHDAAAGLAARGARDAPRGCGRSVPGSGPGAEQLQQGEGLHRR